MNRAPHVLLAALCCQAAAAFTTAPAVCSCAAGEGRVKAARRCLTTATPRASSPLLSAGPPPSDEASLPSKVVWYAAEWFGKAAALVRPPPAVEEGVGDPPASMEEAIARLAADYEGTPEDPRPYFLTGKMDVALYDPDCEFADPFVSFNGRQRFKENLENLAGGFITDSSVRTLDTKASDTSYTTRLLVKLQLGLPWKPVLSWPWGVEHVFDQSSGLIVRHIESWEVSPSEGVRQLLKAGPPRGLKQGQRSSDDDDDDGPQGGGATAGAGEAASPLGTMDPIAGPIVKAARALGLMPEVEQSVEGALLATSDSRLAGLPRLGAAPQRLPRSMRPLALSNPQEEADGWTGEPSAWAQPDSVPQRLSTLTQTRLAGAKQWVAERVAGDFDAAAIDARLDADIGSAGVVLFSFTSCPFCKVSSRLSGLEPRTSRARDACYCSRLPAPHWHIKARQGDARRQGCRVQCDRARPRPGRRRDARTARRAHTAHVGPVHLDRRRVRGRPE